MALPGRMIVWLLMLSSVVVVFAVWYVYQRRSPNLPFRFLHSAYDGTKEPVLTPQFAPAYCESAATLTAIGAEKFPTSPVYGHLEFLGQVFTAAHCSRARLETVYAAVMGQNAIGLRLFLRDVPSRPLLQTLEATGFSCGESINSKNCLEWTHSGRFAVDDLLRFEPFVGELEADDCLDCG